MITIRLPHSLLLQNLRFRRARSYVSPKFTSPLARNKSRPQNIDRAIHPFRQRIVAIYRPQQHRPKRHLPKNARHLERRDVPAKLARAPGRSAQAPPASLSPRAFLSRITFRTDTRREIRLQQRAHDSRDFLPARSSSAATSFGKMRASALCRSARSPQIARAFPVACR